MSVFLVRHGRTGANARGELLGRRDPALDELGERQADATGAELARRLNGRDHGREIVVVTSPLARAAATADRVARALGAPAPVVDDRWIELEYGDLEGVPVADVPTATWAQWRADPTFAPPGGESLVDLRARVAPALADACEQVSAGGIVVVVSHVSPIKAAVAEALGVGDDVTWRLHLSPASITELVARGPRTLVLASFNEAAHRPDA